MNEFSIFSPKTGLIDWWSVGHLIWGWTLGWALILSRSRYPFLKEIKYFYLVGLALSFVWEILEVAARYYGEHWNVAFMKPMAEHENWINALSDIGVNMIGLVIIYSFFQGYFSLKRSGAESFEPEDKTRSQ